MNWLTILKGIDTFFNAVLTFLNFLREKQIREDGARQQREEALRAAKIEEERARQAARHSVASSSNRPDPRLHNDGFRRD